MYAHRLFYDDLQLNSVVGSRAVSAGVVVEEERLWEHLWKLDVPNRVKHFIWRLAHNSLATRTNLERQGMKVGLRCVICNRVGEDGGHLFFGCKAVKEVWRCTGLEHMRVRLAECLDALEVVKLILATKGDAHLQYLFLMNNWWHERNAIREG